jgi:hypothetical protein
LIKTKSVKSLAVACLIKSPPLACKKWLGDFHAIKRILCKKEQLALHRALLDAKRRCLE